MKNLVIILLAIISVHCKANEIDRLKTVEDVNTFLKNKSKNKKIDYFGETKWDTSGQVINEKFLKIDLNDDGLTDLIVNGTYLFVVLDMSNNDFSFHFIDSGAFLLRKYLLARIDSSGNQPMMIVKSYDEEAKYEKKAVKPTYDTLLIKYDGLTEYHRYSDSLGISKLSFSTTMCFGTCPVFELVILADGTAQYNAIKYNPEQGNFEGKIDSKLLAKLFGLVEYLNLRDLRDRYQVNWTDDQTCNLKVEYKNGVTKSIQDYGLVGTFGLQRLYNMLFALRASQTWYPDEN